MRTVSLRGRKQALKADRLEVLTLAWELWGETKLTEKGAAAPRFKIMCDEFDEYVAQLALKSKTEARALYVHVEGPYDPPSKGHRLHKLFPNALFATRGLDVATSAGALVGRALPHAKKGSLVNRLAAIWVIDFALDEVIYHRDKQNIVAAIVKLIHALSSSKEPLLREAGWLLSSSHRRLIASLNKS